MKTKILLCAFLAVPVSYTHLVEGGNVSVPGPLERSGRSVWQPSAGNHTTNWF